jgi:hypothetical protein
MTPLAPAVSKPARVNRPERTSGRPIVKEAVEKYPDCAGERFLMLSCRPSGFSLSCDGKRIFGRLFRGY